MAFASRLFCLLDRHGRRLVNILGKQNSSHAATKTGGRGLPVWLYSFLSCSPRLRVHTCFPKARFLFLFFAAFHSLRTSPRQRFISTPFHHAFFFKAFLPLPRGIPFLDCRSLGTAVTFVVSWPRVTLERERKRFVQGDGCCKPRHVSHPPWDDNTRCNDSSESGERVAEGWGAAKRPSQLSVHACGLARKILLSAVSRRDPARVAPASLV